MLPLRKPTLPGMANPGASPAIGTPTPAPKAPTAGGPGNTMMRQGMPNTSALPGMSGSAGMKANGIVGGGGSSMMPSITGSGSNPPSGVQSFQPSIPGRGGPATPPPGVQSFSGGGGGTPASGGPPLGDGGPGQGGPARPPGSGGSIGGGGDHYVGDLHSSGNTYGGYQGGAMGGIGAGQGSGGGGAAGSARSAILGMAGKAQQAGQYGINTSNRLGGNALNTMLGQGSGNALGNGSLMNGTAGMGGNRSGGAGGASSGIPGLGTNGVPGGPGSGGKGQPSLGVASFVDGGPSTQNIGAADASSMNLSGSPVAASSYKSAYSAYPSGASSSDDLGPQPPNTFYNPITDTSDYEPPAGENVDDGIPMDGPPTNPSSGGGGLINPAPSDGTGMGPPPSGADDNQTNGGSTGGIWDQYPSGGGGSGGGFSLPTGSGAGGLGGLGGGGSGGNSGAGSGAGGASGGLPGLPGMGGVGLGGGVIPPNQGPPGDPVSPPPGPVPPVRPPPGDPTAGTGGSTGTGTGTGGGYYGGSGGGMTYDPARSVGSEGYSNSQGQSGSTNTSHGESQGSSQNQSTSGGTSTSNNQSSNSGSSFSNPNQTMTFGEGMNILGGNPSREANAANPYSRQQYTDESNRENAQLDAGTQSQLEDLMARGQMQGMDKNSPAIIEARNRIIQQGQAAKLANTSKQDAAFRQAAGQFDQTNASQNIGQRGQDVTMSGQRQGIITGLLGQQKSGSENQGSSTGTSQSQNASQSTGGSQNNSFTDASGQSWSRNDAYSQWRPVFAG